MACCCFGFRKKKRARNDNQERRPELNPWFSVSVVATRDTRLKPREPQPRRRFWGCAVSERRESSAFGAGCDHKRSAVCSLVSAGGVTRFRKISVLETILSSCF